MKEYRALGEVDVKEDEQKEMIVSGYALKFDTLSEPMWGITERGDAVELVETIDKEALKNTDMSDVRYLLNHDTNAILGRTTNGTLKIEVDDVGLRYEAKLPNTTLARDTYENIKVGNIDQCSFGFTMKEGDDEIVREEGKYKRIIKNIRELFDLSVVTYPAYKDTDVSVATRSIESYEKDFEEAKLREGLNKEIRELWLENKFRRLRG